MSKDKLIPEIRFPEFKEGKEWVVKKLGLLTNTTIGEFVIKTKQDPNSPYPVYNGGKSYTGFYDEYNNEANKIVISARGANAGFVNLVKQKYWAGNSCYSIEVIEQNKIDLELLFYYIKHNQKRFTDNQQAANIPSVSKGDVEKFQICYPDDILEQQKIASCLSSLDEVITAHSQKLELLKDHKKGLMQNLFPQEGEKVPKVRFKEFEKDGEWVASKIGDFIESHKGGAPLSPSDFVDSSDFEVIPKKAINEGGLLNMSVTSPTYCTEFFYNNNEKSVVDSSFLITTLRDLVPSGPSIGYIVKFNGTKKYILAQGVYGLKPKNTIVPDFLIQFSNTIRYRKLVNAAMVGSTQVHIRNSEFLNLPIQVPKIQEQKKIASCLSSLDALITAQAEKIEQLKLHKKGLMQGLFPKIKN